MQYCNNHVKPINTLPATLWLDWYKGCAYSKYKVQDMSLSKSNTHFILLALQNKLQLLLGSRVGGINFQQCLQINHTLFIPLQHLNLHSSFTTYSDIWQTISADVTIVLVLTLTFFGSWLIAQQHLLIFKYYKKPHEKPKWHTRYPNNYCLTVIYPFNS